MAASPTPRERRRLQRAHENGYLDATGRDPRAVVKAHGLWCWRLKLPMIWFERPTPYSRYALLHLDLLTTSHMLTPAGQSALQALGAKTSPHEAHWERLPLSRLDKLAHAALRAALQPQHYRANPKLETRPKLKLVARKAATA